MMEKNKNEIIKELKEFMYDSKLRDLDVHSRQYLSNILFNKYRDNSKLNTKEPYTVIFGDFNKLNKINKEHGNEAGDQAITTAVSLIKDQLPKNAKISRIGGDEFLFIIEGCTEDKSKEYIANVNKALASDKNGPYNLTIEMEGIDSTHTSGINEMYKTAEKIASDRKNIARSTFTGTQEEVLLAKIENNFSNYLTFFRFPEDFNFNQDCVKELLTKTITTCTNLIEKKTMEKEEEDILDLDNSSMLQDKANDIDNLLTKNSGKSKIAKEDLDEALNQLIREPVSKQLSKKYVENYIEKNSNSKALIKAPKNKFEKVMNNISNLFTNRFKKQPEIKEPSKYNSLFFTTTFMKLSNSEVGHLKTDESLRQIPAELKNELSEYIKFDDSLSDKEKNNIFVDVGGANFLVLYDKDINIENEKLKNIVSKVNEKIPTLQISGVKSTEPIQLSQMSKFISKADQSKEVKLDKLRLKEGRFFSEKSQKALDIALENSMEYYMQTTPDYNSMENKQKFLNLLARGVLNSACKEFTKQQENDIEKQRSRLREKEMLKKYQGQNKTNEQKNIDDKDR